MKGVDHVQAIVESDKSRLSFLLNTNFENQSDYKEVTNQADKKSLNGETFG